MDNLKAKAIEFLRDNEVPEWANHIFVNCYKYDDTTVTEVSLCRHSLEGWAGEAYYSKDGNTSFSECDSGQFFPISELTEQGMTEVQKEFFNDPIAWPYGVERPTFSNELMLACKAYDEARNNIMSSDQHNHNQLLISNEAMAQYREMKR